MAKYSADEDRPPRVDGIGHNEPAIKHAILEHFPFFFYILYFWNFGIFLNY